jgi:biotin transporter BioY
LLILSFYVKTNLLLTGLIPFLPGDLIKNTFAALIASRSSTFYENKK